jgi:multidrug efflux pump subunit AcrA (membrane-fusion protein)
MFVQVTAPELDHQITQAEATLGQKVRPGSWGRRRRAGPGDPDRTFTGKVTRIADALRPGTRTLLTEIDVPNTDGALAPGIYCTVELHIPRKVNSMLVPSEAIIFNRDGLQIAVVDSGIVHIRNVSVARD